MDLAGSEGVTRAKTSGKRLQEGQNINKSLLALAKVIKQLSNNQTAKKEEFINFRDSKLTRILQCVLTGSSQTAIILTMS